MTTAIIVAAGKGLRMKRCRPKQFLPLAGRPILSSTLAAFNACPQIRRIVLVVPAADFDFCRGHVLPDAVPRVGVCLVAGGLRRQDSVYNGLSAMDDGDPDRVVLIHDGVRPFVTPSLICACIDAAREFGACVPCVSLQDTVKRIGDDDTVVRTLDRGSLRLAQTPQAFHFALIRSAHEQARRDNYLGTDDASLVERLGSPVRMIEGSRTNVKITTAEDLAMAEALAAAGLV
ncbi:MAG: 2-C-methyl-D-erythritol 4-phosphate cytidylyltransferase [Desulfobacterales bacterium]|nr:2-C-methyl-D-erythritol 4-phosphate cytidylyltransferase [Desulfobacterales bacterium]